MNRLISVLGLILVASPAASAIGLCEGLETTYQLDSVSESLRQVLVRGEAEWCREAPSGDEERGAVAFAQLRHMDGEVVAWFAAAKDVGHLDGAPAGQVKSLADLDAVLAKGGFVAVKTLETSPHGRCAAKVTTKATKAGPDGWPGTQLWLSVAMDGKPGPKRKLVTTYASGSHAVVAAFLPTSKSLLVWTTPATCQGPPPGYFGDDDDQGECAATYTPRLQTIRAPAACWQAPGKKAK